ncbi:sag-related sequence srs60a [Cystoisospora suis]|uniref:Sag-related sequence srs60a n=1 Tax=Cystoisospora suis TaxID=483139 RepID=A0A2C6KXH4_9APIC|nr:sag-related sequence srs60a [Cystoisospora suis]
MVWQHPQRSALFLAASLCILWARCVTGGPIGGEAGENVQTCADKTIQLEISGRTPLVKFKCGESLIHLLPKIPPGEKGTSCFTEAACKNQGALPEGAGISFDGSSKVYTVEMTKIPTANGAAYFRCTDTEPPTRATAKECIVEVKIKGSPAISQDRQCTEAGKTVNVRLTAPTNEATFACGDNVSTLNPAAPTDVFSDESCTKETKLSTLISKATLTSGTSLEKQRHTLSISTFPEKTTTLCYKCQNSANNEACKVIITVDGTTATSTTTSSTSGARTIMAGAGGLTVVWVAALCAGALYGTTL